jgi:hypothetical protein
MEVLGFHVHILCIYMHDRPSINNALPMNFIDMRSKSYIPEEIFLMCLPQSPCRFEQLRWCEHFGERFLAFFFALHIFIPGLVEVCK